MIDARTDEREMELKAEDNGYWALEQTKEALRVDFAEKAAELKQYVGRAKLAPTLPFPSLPPPAPPAHPPTAVDAYY